MIAALFCVEGIPNGILGFGWQLHSIVVGRSVGLDVVCVRGLYSLLDVHFRKRIREVQILI